MTQTYLAQFGKQMAFPTERHVRAAQAVVDYWSQNVQVQAVLLTCSCARGKAADTSCVDISVLVSPEDLAGVRAEASPAFWRWHHANPACLELEAAVPWSGIDLEITDGVFRPSDFDHHYTSGPDMFEVEIGNTLAWTQPMFLCGDRYQRLADEWLPYYSPALQEERLQQLLHFANNNLDHVSPFAGRGLHMQAFQRLYHALGEYLQALFISASIYPIAYDKWIEEQLADILDRPDIYVAVTDIVALPQLTPAYLNQHAERLRDMLGVLA